VCTYIMGAHSVYVKIIIIVRIFKFKIPNLKSIHRMNFMYTLKGIRKYSYLYEGNLVVNIMPTYLCIKLVENAWLNGRSNEVILHSACLST